MDKYIFIFCFYTNVKVFFTLLRGDSENKGKFCFPILRDINTVHLGPSCSFATISSRYLTVYTEKIYKHSSNVIKRSPKTISPVNLTVFAKKKVHEICPFFAAPNEKTFLSTGTKKSRSSRFAGWNGSTNAICSRTDRLHERDAGDKFGRTVVRRRVIRSIANTVIALRRRPYGRTVGKTRVFPPGLIRRWRWDFIPWWSGCPTPVGPTVEIVTLLTVTCVTSVTGYRYESRPLPRPTRRLAPSVLSFLPHRWLLARFQICEPDDILYRIMGYVRRINYTIPESSLRGEGATADYSALLRRLLVYKYICPRWRMLVN